MRTYPIAAVSLRLLSLPLGLLVLACAGATPATPAASAEDPPLSAPAAQANEPEPAPAATPNTPVSTAPVVCDLACERAKVVARAEDTPDYTAVADANANAVLDAMRGDLLACYKTRLTARPTAHGFITATIVINPQGGVKRVETTGGAILGEKTMACIVERIQRGKFDPPRGGGTLTVVAPFSLVRMAADDTTL